MRARLVFLGILPVAWTACFSSNDAAPRDGSPEPIFDASEMDAVTPPAEAEAAVDAPPTSMDAPVEATPEAAPAVDAPTEAGPAPVVVTVVGALGPESGIAVVWSDASGAVVATTTTGATGATSMSASGGMVTALLGTSSSPSLYTITGVQAGDALVLVDWTSLALLPGGQSGGYFTNTVSFTSLPPSLPGATSSVQFLSGADCSNGYDTPLSLPAQLTLTANGSNGVEPTCVGVGPIGASYGAAYPALVEADDASGSFLAFAFAKNNGFASVDDAGGLDVAIGGTWSTSTTTQTLSEANLTVGQYPWSYYSEAANGVLVPLSTQPQPSGLDASTSASDTFYATHPGFADFVQSEIGNGVSGGFAMIATRAPAPTANGATTMDVDQLASIPLVSGMAVDATDAARPGITWTGTSSPLTTATALVANLSWNGTDPEGGFQSGNWAVVAAAGSQTGVQMPALPASLAEWAPIAGSNFYPGVAIVEGGTSIPGYAQARAAASAFYPIVQTTCPAAYGPAIPALPADGTVMVSYAGGGCG